MITHNLNLRRIPRLQKYFKNTITKEYVTKMSKETFNPEEIDEYLVACMRTDDQLYALIHFGLLGVDDVLKIYFGITHIRPFRFLHC